MRPQYEVNATPLAAAAVVLYVEDDPVNALLVQQLLAAHRPHCTLHVAADGRSGLDLARRIRPRLVLIDMNLPDISGVQVLQELRRDPATQALRCIALSADATPETVECALAAGFEAYWTKPIDIHEFLRQFDEQLACGP